MSMKTKNSTGPHIIFLAVVAWGLGSSCTWGCKEIVNQSLNLFMSVDLFQFRSQSLLTGPTVVEFLRTLAMRFTTKASLRFHNKRILFQFIPFAHISICKQNRNSTFVHFCVILRIARF